MRPIAGPREFLDRYGISDSQWDGFVVGQPLSPAEEEVLIRLLSLYPRFGQESVEAWALRDLTWDQLAASGQEHRGKIVRLTGRVERAVRMDLIPEVRERYEFAHFYRVQMRIDGASHAALVYCRELPSAWKLDTELDEQASAYGLFLKVGDEGQEPTPLLFATHRVAWHPHELRPELHVSAAHVALASLGVDIGRFQEVGKERATGLLAVDREPFYQILAALGDQRASDLLIPERKGLDLAALLQEPHQFQGQVLPVQGLARRVARIDVSDPDIRQRFGIDHYYEVDLSLPLDRAIRLAADPKNEAEAVVYPTGFPASICVRELPPGLAVGDDLRQPVQSEAVFFKIWLYHSSYTSPAQRAQPAPFFLARQVRIVEEESGQWWSEAILGAAMVLALLTFVGIVLWFRWTDRSYRRGKPLAEAAQPKPDFTNLR